MEISTLRKARTRRAVREILRQKYSRTETHGDIVETAIGTDEKIFQLTVALTEHPSLGEVELSDDGDVPKDD